MRGLIQLTGRHNYRKAGEALGLQLELYPELAATPEVATEVACWYWTSRNLNHFADNEDFLTITRKINGGFNHLEERKIYWQIAKAALY